jgi:excinuclease ABC subunit B
MKVAIDETERRRAKQIAYNAERGIVPQPLNKKVTDILEDSPYASKGSASAKIAIAAERGGEYAVQEKMTPAQLASHIKKLEKQMYQAAKDLDFETAASLRDQIKSMKSDMVGVGDLG